MLAQNSSRVSYRLGKRGWLVVGGMGLVVLGIFLYLALNWPFTKAAVLKRLEDASSSRVDIGNFRSTYFPHPGCVASQVVIHQGSRTDLAPLITVKQLRVQNSILGMLTKHVAVIKADGMQIDVPRQSEQNFKSSSDTVIDKLIASDATLKFESHGKGKGLEFKIHEAELHNVGGLGAMRFRLRLSNPEPPGEIEAGGTFGPWVIGHAGQTKVSGQYVLQGADLSVFRGIAGLLSSKGSFSGTLEHIIVKGFTDTPEFTVTTSRHKTELKNQFDAVVDGTNGNVSLQHVDAQLRRTRLSGKGEVAKREAKARRAAILDLCSRDGRIQDLFLLFIKADRSPITGITNFCAHTTLPSGKEPFLRKVLLAGDFGVDVGNFSQPETQENVNKLSAESVGGDDEKAATVLSSLRGHVEIKGGTAKFTNLSFGIPGALAQMQGNYDLVTHSIDLHGTLKMDSEPSHMAHGPKALLLKFVDPFFKKKQGSEVPVKITGTYEKPSFGLDLGGKKPNSASKRLQRMYQSGSKTKPTGER
jgi:hypothetical protein